MKKCPYYEIPFPGKKCESNPCPKNTDPHKCVIVEKKKEGKNK
jgi:hypothetical protein